jgi:hypothetical protein
MVVARNTAAQVLRVIERFVAKEHIGDLIEDLSEVTGNKSYQDTIELLRKQYKAERQRE